MIFAPPKTAPHGCRFWLCDGVRKIAALFTRDPRRTHPERSEGSHSTYGLHCPTDHSDCVILPRPHSIHV